MTTYWQTIGIILSSSPSGSNNPFRKGVTLLSRNDKSVCPVIALLQYLAVRGSKQGPLFLMANQQYLIPPLFPSSLFHILRAIKVSTQEYNTHSFWIGVATSGKAAGISDLHIKMLGRWQNDPYQSYIRTPTEDLLVAKLSKLLIYCRVANRTNITREYIQLSIAS